MGACSNVETKPIGSNLVIRCTGVRYSYVDREERNKPKARPRFSLDNCDNGEQEDMLHKVVLARNLFSTCVLFYKRRISHRSKNADVCCCNNDFPGSASKGG